MEFSFELNLSKTMSRSNDATTTLRLIRVYVLSHVGHMGCYSTSPQRSYCGSIVVAAGSGQFIRS